MVEATSPVKELSCNSIFSSAADRLGGMAPNNPFFARLKTVRLVSRNKQSGMEPPKLFPLSHSSLSNVKEHRSLGKFTGDVKFKSRSCKYVRRDS